MNTHASTFFGRRRAVGITLLGITAVVIGGVAWATGTSTPNETESMLAPSYSAAQATSISTTDANAFGVLREASSATMPAAVAKNLSENPILAKFGANSALAHLASSVGSTPQVWVIPANEALCLFVRYSADDGGSTCQANQYAQEGYLNILRSGSDGTTTVIGLAPDTVRSVQATTSHGAARADVANNIYTLANVVGGRQLVVGSTEIDLP